MLRLVISSVRAHVPEARVMYIEPDVVASAGEPA